ncbi:MAG: hypothetical protein B7X00_01740, partial [Legionella sp. 21-45-4]
MYYYHAFGLSIASEFSLPEMMASPPVEADVIMSRGIVDPHGLTKPNPNQLWINVPAVGRF